jgi:hypothetical protein
LALDLSRSERSGDQLGFRHSDATIEAAAVEFKTDVQKLIAIQRYEIASS